MHIKIVRNDDKEKCTIHANHEQFFLGCHFSVSAVVGIPIGHEHSTVCHKSNWEWDKDSTNPIENKIKIILSPNSHLLVNTRSRKAKRLVLSQHNKESLNRHGKQRRPAQTQRIGFQLQRILSPKGLSNVVTTMKPNLGLDRKSL